MFSTVLNESIASNEKIVSDEKVISTIHKGIPMWLQKAAAFSILAILSPLCIAVCILLKLDSKGPLFFAQTRVGEHGRQFRCYKFRSMYTADSIQWQVAANMKSDREGVCQKMYRRKWEICRALCWVSCQNYVKPIGTKQKYYHQY